MNGCVRASLQIPFVLCVICFDGCFVVSLQSSAYRYVTSRYGNLLLLLLLLLSLLLLLLLLLQIVVAIQQ